MMAVCVARVPADVVSPAFCRKNCRPNWTQSPVWAEVNPVPEPKSPAVRAADMDLVWTGGVGADGGCTELAVGLHRGDGEDQSGTGRRGLRRYGRVEDRQVIQIVGVALWLEIELRSVRHVGGSSGSGTGSGGEERSGRVIDAQIPVAGRIGIHVDGRLSRTTRADDGVVGGIEAIDGAGGGSLRGKLRVNREGGERSGVAGIAGLLEIEGHAVGHPVTGSERIRAGAAAHQARRRAAGTNIVGAGGVGVHRNLVQPRGGYDRDCSELRSRLPCSPQEEPERQA